jgi:hypothetical protein
MNLELVIGLLKKLCNTKKQSPALFKFYSVLRQLDQISPIALKDIIENEIPKFGELPVKKKMSSASPTGKRDLTVNMSEPNLLSPVKPKTEFVKPV